MADQSEEEEKLEPLVIFYDSEAANGNVYYGDVIEIAATCHPGVVVGSFERLINTKQDLGLFAINESGITEDLLKGKPFIDEVMVEFLDWVDEMVVLAQKKNNTCYFPVICAHGGYQFDFLILFANLERRGMPYSKFSDLHIHFADSFLFCQKLQQDGNKYLQDTRLSIDGLFHNFFPKHTIKERHRAMGDVKAMVKIFTQTPLKNVLHLMSVSSTLERVKYFVSQSSAKEQLLLLEEKMSSLDACSRNMCSKRLIKEGLTYDLLKTVFQKCSSYMDFWQTLKKIGIDRKVAKHFTSQFGAMGLENQGSLGYNLNAALQNGSLSYGSSRDSNGHANGAVNGNSRPNKGNAVKSVSSKSKITSNINEKDSSEAKVVIGTTRAERATSSSKAFAERPFDYAVTSSADERLKTYDMLRSAKQDKKDASKNVKVDSEREIKSSLETNAVAESKIADSLSSENTSSSTDASICNGDENWDSEIENSVTRGHFVLQFNEVIPASIVYDDVCSSTGESSVEQQADVNASHSRRVLKKHEAKQGKRNVGKESASHDKRKNDGTSSAQGKRHEHELGQAKKGSELSTGINKNSRSTEKLDTMVILGRSNKATKEEILGTKTKSKGIVVSSGGGKQGNVVSSAGKELQGLKQVSHNTSAGNLLEVTDGENTKTSSYPVEQVGQKEPDDKKGVKTKRKNKTLSKKKPMSVTFVTPVGIVSEDPSSDLPEDGVDMTTVYVGEVPILVPVKRQSVPCEDSLDQPTHEDKAVDTGNGNISTDGTTVPREKGITIKDESVRNPTTDADRMVASKERKHGNPVDKKIEDGTKQEMNGFEQAAKGPEKALLKTAIPDEVPSASTSESLSGLSYETSDTGSNLDCTHQTSPPLTEEKKNPPQKRSSNHSQSDDNANTYGSEDQASTVVELPAGIHQTAAPTTEKQSSYAMETENINNTDQDSENVCAYDESQPVTEQSDLPVDPSSQFDITPDVANQEQTNGFSEGPWNSSDVVYPNPNMYPVPQPQYPLHMPYPTAMPSAYGFYPAMPHMMPVIHGHQPVPYPMSFASRGVMPFGAFPPRFPMAMPIFQPSIYPNVQQGPRPYLGMSEQDPTPQTSSSSPEVLGIPDSRIQATEYQYNQTPTGISNVSYSTSSDDHSARSSPFPVDDSVSSGKTTPLTTPHRSPIDDNSTGALSSSDKGEKGQLTHNRRKGYRKDTRTSRYNTDERSRRSNRNGSWKVSSYRGNGIKNVPSEKVSYDLAEAPKTKGSDGVSEERKNHKVSDGPLKEDQHSPRCLRKSNDQDVNSSSKSLSKPPKSEKLTPPRNEERDGAKYKRGTSKLSPNRDVQSGHSSPHASPTKSSSEQLTPPREEEKEHSPKTSRRDTRSERSEEPPKDERNVSSDSVDNQQISSTDSKSSSKSTQDDSHKAQQSVGINKRVSKESQKSSYNSNLNVPSSKTSQVRTNPSNSSSSDGVSIAPKDAPAECSSGSPAPPSSGKDQPQNQKDGVKVTFSGNPNNEASKQKACDTETRNIKWPQSALATQKFKEPPKPQREQSSRRRIRDSRGSGNERDKRIQSHRQSVASRRNEDVKVQLKSTDPTAGENKHKDGKTASEKVQTKESLLVSGNDFKTESDGRLQKNTTGHSESKKNVNYRDVLLGKQNSKAKGNEGSSLNTNIFASSDGVKEGSSCGTEPRPHPQAAKEKNQPVQESGSSNGRGSAQPGDQEKTFRKEYRKDKEPSEKRSYRESRAVNAARGSTREPASRSRNPTRHKYDTNNNNIFQSRNAVSKASKS